MQFIPWRWKLGYAIPSWNTVIEYETARMVPPDTSVHFSRIIHTNDSPQSLAAMTEEFPQHVELLLHADLDAICYGCTGASFLGGRKADLELTRSMSERFGKPVVSMAGALVDAAEALGLSRVAVAAPYEPWLLERLVVYLREAGLTVTNSVGLGQQANILHGPDMARDLARRAWTEDSDGVILSCGNLRTLEVLELTEADIGAPVVSSNQAALWRLLQAVGWQGRLDNIGRLFQREHPAQPPAP